MRKKRKISKRASTLGNVIFALHVVFVVLWLGLFFVPLSMWPQRSVFHFWLTTGIIVHQFVWGFLIWPQTKKFRFPCFLTSMMQLARGYKLSDPKNYDHSFVSEGFKDLGMKVPTIAVTILTFVVLSINLYQFFTG